VSTSSPSSARWPVQDWIGHRSGLSRQSHAIEGAGLTRTRKATAHPRIAPFRSTIHNELVTLRLVLKDAVRRGTLSHLPDLSMPYRKQGKVEHRPLFSPRTIQTALYGNARLRSGPHHDTYNGMQSSFTTMYCHDEHRHTAGRSSADNLLHQDVSIVEDATAPKSSNQSSRKRGVGYCTSTPPPYAPIVASRKGKTAQS